MDIFLLLRQQLSFKIMIKWASHTKHWSKFYMEESILLLTFLIFDKDSLQQLTDNLRKPGGRIPDPNPNAAEGATIPTPAFTYEAKSGCSM